MALSEPRDPQQARLRVLGTTVAILVYVFLVLPSLIVIPISFGGSNNFEFPPKEFSLDLYRQFFASVSWTSPMVQSAKVAVLTMVFSLLFGVPAAYGLVRFEFPMKKVIILLIMSPLIMPSVVIGLGLYLYFNTLRLTGSTFALVCGHMIYVTPFVIMVVGAGVQKLDRSLEFASMLMGASRITMFRTVVIPQLLPSIIAGALFAFLLSFDEVVISWFLVGAQTTTLPVKMYSSIQWEISPVIAAVSTMLTAASLLVCVATAWLQRNPASSS